MQHRSLLSCTSLPGLLALVSVLVSSPSQAQGVGDACDATTPEYVCSGDALLFCVTPDLTNPTPEDNTYQEALNCATDLAVVGGASCSDVTGFGATCQMNTGADCLFSTDTATINFPCANTNEGCGYSPQADWWICASGAGMCTPAAEGQTYAANCANNQAVWGCNAAGQPLFDDCDAIGGTCQDGLGCVEVQADGICDGEAGTFDGMNGPFWTCATGLTCAGLSDTTYGICTAPSPDAGVVDPTDAGTPAMDAGTEEPTDAGTPAADAGTEEPTDAGTPATDAGTEEPTDAGTPATDAGTEEPTDAGTGTGGGSSDAGSPTGGGGGAGDAGTTPGGGTGGGGTGGGGGTAVDAGTATDDKPEDAPSGCSASGIATAWPGASLALLLSMVGLMWRRRRD